jgi:hypothetical protein
MRGRLSSHHHWEEVNSVQPMRREASSGQRQECNGKSGRQPRMMMRSDLPCIVAEIAVCYDSGKR